MKMKAPSWLKGLVRNASHSQVGSSHSSSSAEDAWIDSVPVAPKVRPGYSLARLVQPSSMASSNSVEPRLASADELRRAVDYLLNICNGRKASPLMRPLAGCWLLISEAVEKQQGDVPPAAAAALHVAAEFLTVGKSMSLQMQFALLVHTDKVAMSRFSGDVEGTIVLLCQGSTSSRQYHGPSEAAVADEWHRCYGAFRKRCKQLWELFTYFVFLDAKGEVALLRMVARQIQTLLEMPAVGLVANMSNTGAWAQPALLALSQGLVQPFLEQMHKKTLEEWHAALQAAAAAAVTAACNSVHIPGQNLEELRTKMTEELHKQQAKQFWGHYFHTLSHTSWPDFVEAFKDCFCGGSCPQDILDRLRAHIAKPCKHRVSMVSYEAILKRHPGGFPSLLAELMKEVLEDLPFMIYRKPTTCTVPEKSARGSTEVDSEVLQHFARAGFRRCKTEPVFSREQGSSPPGSAPVNGSPVLSPLELVTREKEQSESSESLPNNWAPPGVVMVEHSLPNGSVTAGSVTPMDPRLAQGVIEPGEKIGWNDFLEQLSSFSRPWWAGLETGVGERSSPSTQAATGAQLEETPWVQAIRAVKSSLCPTRKALILRVASGSLAAGRPQLIVPPRAIFPPPTERSPRTAWAQSEAPLPGIVITPNDTGSPCVTKAGRGPAEGTRISTALPELLMSEPIASRSHFSIVYNPDKDKYQVMDMGSKWGTFMKVTTQGQPVSCGDWVRIGNAELIVRFCGGGCRCNRKHSHYRLHSLSVAQTLCSTGFFRSGRLGRTSSQGLPQLFKDSSDGDDDDDHDGAADMHDQVVSMVGGMSNLTGASQQAWPSTLQRSMSRVHNSRSPQKSAEITRINSAPKFRSMAWTEADDLLDETLARWPEGLNLPAAPLELDFISGPRMGERLLVTDRICTVGRGEKSTIQLSDQTLANVSRTHCVFKCMGGRWWLFDNNSTNGTWHRLSCVLQPSEPKELHTGATILAGIQEFKVEEAEMSRWCIPSPASRVLQEFCLADQYR
eukprot:TRINITY_DN15386_c0_g2_i1.p1 TRINITY_DN15386_c0_g2~~TRINITY_DN15386_c0_g2_i1.p1  ORF type:complete len:1012 (-),score=155.87 TRINITY_DN15386_c0_g2_i1:171-3206(-)